jgi:molybdate transport system ATP-binding protein
MSLRVAGRIARGDVVRDVEVEVADGEVVAVMGPNGAGKSTLLRTVAGLHRCAWGSIVVDGETWDDSVDCWVPPRRRNVGLVMQSPVLFPGRSVASNVAFGPRARGESREASRAAAARWLERVGADHLAARRADSLSGGESQRVALARALAAKPRLLLLDEPLSAVDAGSAPALVETIRDVLGDFGGAALVVLHDTAAAHALADRILHLEFTPGR